jgi:hypothetical protein
MGVYWSNEYKGGKQIQTKADIKLKKTKEGLKKKKKPYLWREGFSKMFLPDHVQAIVGGRMFRFSSDSFPRGISNGYVSEIPQI